MKHWQLEKSCCLPISYYRLQTLFFRTSHDSLDFFKLKTAELAVRSAPAVTNLKCKYDHCCENLSIGYCVSCNVVFCEQHNEVFIVSGLAFSKIEFEL